MANLIRPETATGRGEKGKMDTWTHRQCIELELVYSEQADGTLIVTGGLCCIDKTPCRRDVKTKECRRDSVDINKEEQGGVR